MFEVRSSFHEIGVKNPGTIVSRLSPLTNSGLTEGEPFRPRFESPIELDEHDGPTDVGMSRNLSQVDRDEFVLQDGAFPVKYTSHSSMKRLLIM